MLCSRDSFIVCGGTSVIVGPGFECIKLVTRQNEISKSASEVPTIPLIDTDQFVYLEIKLPKISPSATITSSKNLRLIQEILESKIPKLNFKYMKVETIAEKTTESILKISNLPEDITVRTLSRYINESSISDFKVTLRHPVFSTKEYVEILSKILLKYESIRGVFITDSSLANPNSIEKVDSGKINTPKKVKGKNQPLTPTIVNGNIKRTVFSVANPIVAKEGLGLVLILKKSEADQICLNLLSKTFYDLFKFEQFSSAITIKDRLTNMDCQTPILLSQYEKEIVNFENILIEYQKRNISNVRKLTKFFIDNNLKHGVTLHKSLNDVFMHKATECFSNEVTNDSTTTFFDLTEHICMVCLDEEDDEGVLLSCSHFICKPCFELTLKNAINSRAFPIKCFSPKCGELYDVRLIKDRLNREDLKRLVEATFEHYVGTNRTVYLHCLTPDCLQIYEFKTGSFRCDLCNLLICTDCNSKDHNGLTCKECEDAGDNLDGALLEKYKKEKDIRNCPNCKIPIEKNMGCNRMTCHNCKSTICWFCMSLFTTETIYTHMKAVHGSYGHT